MMFPTSRRTFEHFFGSDRRRKRMVPLRVCDHLKTSVIKYPAPHYQSEQLPNNKYGLKSKWPSLFRRSVNSGAAGNEKNESSKLQSERNRNLKTSLTDAPIYLSAAGILTRKYFVATNISLAINFLMLIYRDFCLTNLMQMCNYVRRYVITRVQDCLPLTELHRRVILMQRVQTKWLIFFIF